MFYIQIKPAILLREMYIQQATPSVLPSMGHLLCASSQGGRSGLTCHEGSGGHVGCTSRPFDSATDPLTHRHTPTDKGTHRHTGTQTDRHTKPSRHTETPSQITPEDIRVHNYNAHLVLYFRTRISLRVVCGWVSVCLQCLVCLCVFLSVDVCLRLVTGTQESSPPPAHRYPPRLPPWLIIVACSSSPTIQPLGLFIAAATIAAEQAAAGTPALLFFKGSHCWCGFRVNSEMPHACTDGFQRLSRANTQSTSSLFFTFSYFIAAIVNPSIKVHPGLAMEHILWALGDGLLFGQNSKISCPSLVYAIFARKVA